MNTKKTFGTFIRKKRMEQQIGLREMSKMIGVSPTYLSKVERDEMTPPNEERIRALALLIKSDPDELLAMAGRLPPDITAIIKQRPIEISGLLRTVNRLSSEEIVQMERTARESIKDKLMQSTIHQVMQYSEVMQYSVPYIPKENIELQAQEFLSEYESKHISLSPPIPIDDIAESYLQLQIEFVDMHDLYSIPRPVCGNSDILGAIYRDGRVLIDVGLDPDNNPSSENRYRFTLAHEVAHWNLHQELLKKDTEPVCDGIDKPISICRKSQAPKTPEEWQANYYAACLLMPYEMIIEHWKKLFSEHQQQPPILPLSVLVERSCDINMDIDQVLEEFCSPLAERFLVSPCAMRVRLQYMGLIYRDI